jgi:hypothetical protein
VVVINYGCEDFLPVRFPQSGDVGFEIVQSKSHVADHASADIAQVRPVFGRRVGIGRHIAVRVVVIGDGEGGAHLLISSTNHLKWLQVQIDSPNMRDAP